MDTFQKKNYEIVSYYGKYIVTLQHWDRSLTIPVIVYCVNYLARETQGHSKQQANLLLRKGSFHFAPDIDTLAIFLYNSHF